MSRDLVLQALLFNKTLRQKNEILKERKGMSLDLARLKSVANRKNIDI